MPDPTRPLTVLQVCSIKGRGGTGYMASRICRLLAEAGHTVIVGACRGSKMEERARENGITTLDGLRLRRGFHPVDLYHDIQTLRTCICENNVDIVHAWHSIEYWTCATALVGMKAKLARTRGLVTPIRAHMFNRLIHNRTAALFATCGRIEQIYREAGFRMDNVFRLDDGVDINAFRPNLDGGAIRREAGIPPEAFVIASVGRLEKVKNQATLLAALAALPENAHALFAGDGSQREQLEADANRHGVAHRAHFLGVRSDIPPILAAADAYCLCSIGSEGSSRATLEAMACGLPCITTTVGMLPDIVKPGLTGLLFPPEDIDALSECLENLMNDTRLRQRLGDAALAMVREKHSEEAMRESIVSAYRRVLADEKAKPA